MAIELTPEQRYQAMVEEAEYQLIVMKQYLSDDEKEKYIWMVERYGGFFERADIMKRYEKAWG